MENLNDFYYFAEVVDHGGFAPASRALGKPKSMLSRRVAALEQRLGVRLIQRSTRRFSVTEVGQEFYLHCKAMLEEAAAATQAVELARSEPRGLIRMACPVALLHARVGAMIGAFLASCPQVRVHLQALNRPVDVIAEGYDFAIRVRPVPLGDSELVLKPLGMRSQCLVASPALLRQTNPPAVPADLVNFPSLDLERPEHVWHLVGPNAAKATIRHVPRLVTDDMVALRDAAVAGVGIAHLPLMMVTGELKRGTLMKLLAEWAPRAEMIHAVLPSKRHLRPAVRALIDFLAEEFQKLEEI
ncbi:MAG: LysR family transcriptional regulator [Burkholderiales bacterium]|nr:LysR family transcriptional regulator [Burkholderiales bacterium]